MTYGQYQRAGRPDSGGGSRQLGGSQNRPVGRQQSEPPRIKPSERFIAEYFAAYDCHQELEKLDESVTFTGRYWNASGYAKDFEYKFGIADWANNYNRGSAGLLYMYADDRNGAFSVCFVPEVVIVGDKPPPGWFQDGVGPLGRIAYELGGEAGINDLKRWEADFSESARLFITYDAPLSSDMFSIAEGLTGRAIEGRQTFSDSERAQKIVEGLKGIAELVTGEEAGELLYAFISSAVDYFIEHNLAGETKAIVSEAKKDFDQSKDLMDRVKRIKGH